MVRKRASSNRIEKMKQEILSSIPTIGIERGLLVTEAYNSYKDQPILLKRALALQHILKHTGIRIGDEEIIIGNQSQAIRWAPLYPENFIGWMEADDTEMDAMEQRSVNPIRIPHDIRPTLRDIAHQWRGKTLVEQVYDAFPVDIAEARKALLFSVSLEKNAMGHNIPDFPMLLAKGFNEIKKSYVEQLKNIDRKNPAEKKKEEFLEAGIIVMNAAIAFSKRYSKLAREMAIHEPDPERKQDLVEIARITEKVPEYPAESFHEALQSVYFVHTVHMIESNAYSMSYGRVDQYLRPYLEHDLDSGILTNEQAQEILECFWCKMNEVMFVDDKETIHFHGGHPFGQHVTVGGVDREGRDATNALSYMCLDAHADVGLFQPDFSVRFHKDSPNEFQRRAAEVIRLGHGLPQIFNDEVLIGALVHDGLPIKEARDYTPTGCVENATPACWIRAPGGWLNVLKILELALHQGRCALSGKQITHFTKPVNEVGSFDELYHLFEEHFREAVELHVRWSNSIDDVHAALMPQPSVSVLTHDCMENGKDAVQGGARYNFTSPLLVGIANVTDSLSVIREMVFNERKLSLPELVEALDADFEGHEILYTRIKNFKKRYGNDIAEVDQIARKISILFTNEFSKYRNTRGGKFRPGFWSVTANFNLGPGTAASADGRRAGQPLSDSISPNEGKDINGLTASLHSAAALDQARASNGTVLNRHISPKDMEGERGIERFLDVVNGYFTLGGSNLGFNIISTETLKRAQREPEKYSDLMVKVAGYAAFFTELGKGSQDAIIARTEHHL